MSAKGKEPAQRLGTPHLERSKAPSSSPPPFDQYPSDLGVGGTPSSSRGPFGSGRGGVERAGSPLKRYTSTSASALRQVNLSPTPTAPSSHAGDEGSLGLRGQNALGLQRAAEEAVSRTRIVADPSIATAFSRTEDRELWELFLQ